MMLPTVRPVYGGITVILCFLNHMCTSPRACPLGNVPTEYSPLQVCFYFQ